MAFQRPSQVIYSKDEVQFWYSIAFETHVLGLTLCLLTLVFFTLTITIVDLYWKQGAKHNGAIQFYREPSKYGHGNVVALRS